MPISPSDLATEYRAATENVALFDLSDHGKITLRGPDARVFLQNLCTQDVKSLPVGGGCEAFLTTNKARVVAHIWISNHQQDSEEGLWLDMVAGQGDKVLAHLNHYLISEQVELTDLTREYALLRLVGPDAAAPLARLTDAKFQSLLPLYHVFVPGIGCIRRQLLLGIEGFDLICLVSQAAEFRQRLVEAGAILAGFQTYDILRIEAGLPHYGVDIDENRLAMEVGRTAQAISYTKGCYLGQETIVMARDRGQVNRLLMGVKVADGSPLAAGTKLFKGSEDVGQVTSSVQSPRLGQVIALRSAEHT